ncbi:hypothetical protein CQA01_14600 [Cyclobacterium qasimii]|uniref:Uncharacterized protein n=1 Tax=Cyclobacterium qasimii TaxID=1350429 RepID=A0A512C9N6_9BACT|nr:hypothetical protein CQA01_14600 [Cyclobacterium qasimii]
MNKLCYLQAYNQKIQLVSSQKGKALQKKIKHDKNQPKISEAMPLEIRFFLNNQNQRIISIVLILGIRFDYQLKE